MKIVVVATLFGIVFAVAVADMPPKAPLVFSSWPPKMQKSPMRGMLLQIRSGTSRGPPGFLMKPGMMPSRFIRPFKSGAPLLRKPPVMMIKSAPKPPPVLLKRPYPLPLPTTKRFQGSPPGPNSGEYIFDNLFNNQLSAKINSVPIPIHINDDSGPFHTIPAPNLALDGIKHFDIHEISSFHNNHIDEQHEPEPQYIHRYPVRPETVPQYQVTEEPTLDQTIADPISGHIKYFAPDPDPHFPAAKLRLAHDPLSNPSNGKPLPSDVYHSHEQSTELATASALTQSNPYFQMVHAVPQQQLPDSYVLPISNQPQLQQHILRQASVLQGMPPSHIYNPTFLVSKSNELLQQHQQLFKPASESEESSSGFTVQSGYRAGSIQPSSAQLFTADDTFSIQDYSQNLDTAASENIPVYMANNQKAVVANYVDSSDSFELMPSSTEGAQEVTDLYDVAARQHENDQTISQAHQKLLHQQMQAHDAEKYALTKQMASDVSAHEHHQAALAQSLNAAAYAQDRLDDDSDEDHDDDEDGDSFESDDEEYNNHFSSNGGEGTTFTK